MKDLTDKFPLLQTLQKTFKFCQFNIQVLVNVEGVYGLDFALVSTQTSSASVGQGGIEVFQYMFPVLLPDISGCHESK